MTPAVAVILLLVCSQTFAQDYNQFYRHPRHPSLPASNPPFEQLPYGERYVVQHATMMAEDSVQEMPAVHHAEIEEENSDDYEYYYQPHQPIQTVNLVKPVQPVPPIVRVEASTPDIYRNICPCKPAAECARPYGIGIFDVRDFGAIAPCREYGLVRCCGNPLPTPAPEVEIMRLPAQEQKLDNELSSHTETAAVHGNQPMAPEHVAEPVAPSRELNKEQPTKVEMIYYTPAAQEEVKVKVPAQHSGITVHHAYQQAAQHKQEIAVKAEPSYQKHHQAEHVQIFPWQGSQVESAGQSSNTEQFATIKEMSNNQYKIDTPVLPPSTPGQTPLHVKYEIPQTPKVKHPHKTEPETVPVAQYNKPETKPEYEPSMQSTVVPAHSTVHVSYVTPEASTATSTTTTTTTPAPAVYATTAVSKPRPIYRHNVKHQMKHPNMKYPKAPQHAPVSHDSSATTESGASITTTTTTTESPLNLPILEPIVEGPNTLTGASVSVSSSVPGSVAFASVSVSDSLPVEHRDEAQQVVANKPAEKHEPHYAAPAAPGASDIVATPTTGVPCLREATTTTQAPISTGATGSKVEYGGFQPMSPYESTKNKVETPMPVTPVVATPAPAAETPKTVPQGPLTVPQPLPTYGQPVPFAPINPVPVYHKAPAQQLPQYAQPQLYPIAPAPAASHPSQVYSAPVPAAMQVPRAQYPKYSAQSAYRAAPMLQRPVYHQRPQQAAAYQPKPQMHVPHPALPQAPMTSPYAMPKPQLVPAKPYAQRASPAY